MESPLALNDFFALYGAMDRKTFVGTFSSPFLIVDLSGLGLSSDSVTTVATQPARGRTGEPDATGPRAWSLWVMSVARSPRNPVPDTVTLGRSSGNDLVITHGSVSKVHACFRTDPSGRRFSIFDAGSSYGSTVNGKLVDAASGCPLMSGDTIVLAKAVRARFFFPDGLYDYLHGAKPA